MNSSIRYCAQADRYKKHNCCESKISTSSDNPKGYDALCDACKIVQMLDDIEKLNKVNEELKAALEKISKLDDFCKQGIALNPQNSLKSAIAKEALEKINHLK